ncbi:2-hydroxyacid dehydrogenase [Caproicibacter sp. BJN0012]|uniref:2-hydroxyacid dehydrogenase n=1 Tax=Caproicibacter sp. BJN0012 TaxID=3110227 RepID=UPI002E0EE8A2
MKKTKILLVSDGGVTKALMQKMYELEPYGAEITLVEDTDMPSMGYITDRMGLLEREGINAAPSCEPLLENCADKEIIVVHVASINREVIAASPNLKVAAVLRGGIENADAPALKERGIKLINAPWRSADAVADFTVGMMIAENKNIARAHKLLFEGKWCKNYTNQSYIHNMNRSTVGIIGFGYIGRRVADRAKAFGSKIVVFDPFQKPEAIERAGCAALSLEELLKQSDYVTIHMRLSDQTREYLGEKEFSLMKPTAYFINTARAGLVDTSALLKALQTKSIGGAAIDVFDKEPLSQDNPFLKLDNVTLTPHLAGTSCDTMRNSVDICFEDIKNYIQGKPMTNISN